MNLQGEWKGKVITQGGRGRNKIWDKFGELEGYEIREYVEGRSRIKKRREQERDWEGEKRGRRDGISDR